MAEASQKQVLVSLKSCLNSGAYSDLTITCGSDTYKVHKVIVCERADFFARALKFGGQESQNSTIDLPEDEPAIVKLFMQYLYEGEYEPLLPDTKVSQLSIPTTSARIARTGKPKSKACDYTYQFPHTCDSTEDYCTRRMVCPHHTCGHHCSYWCQNFNCEECNPLPPTLPIKGTSDQLPLHAKMYEIADKYDVRGLKDLVIEKFTRSCQKFWDNPKFAAAAYHAFMTTPDKDKGLCDIVSATISAHMELVEKPEIKVLMREFNGLALGILEEKIKEHGWGKKKT